MNKKRAACIAFIAVLVAGGCMQYYEDPDASTAQAVTDRATVDCLTSQLTRDEKLGIARLSADHDEANLRRVYGDVFARCVLRADQWDRRSQLVTSARQTLSYDPEFQRLLAGSTMRLTRRSDSDH